MAGRMEGKVAIVTGGASGMGAATSRIIVNEGGKVVIADIAIDAAEALAAELGENAAAFRLNVTDAAQWKEVVDFTEKTFGAVHGLVNNAGILAVGPLEEETEETWDKVMDINGKGVFLGMKAVLPGFKRAGAGAIVNMSSAGGLTGLPFMNAYTASKFAVRGITKSAAVELAPENIRVNSVHPGRVATPMTTAEGYVGDADDKNLLTRFAQPEEVSALVVFLLSDEASFMTGGEYTADGGITAA